MTELATLAPEVEASLGADADASSPPPAPIIHAIAEVARLLRDEADRRGADDGAELLRALAGRLEAPHAWATVDRVVHELVGALVGDALEATDDGVRATLVARGFALRTLARQEALWPGASGRNGCPYDYGGLLATVRLSALAA